MINKHVEKNNVLEEGIKEFDWDSCENPVQKIKRNSRTTEDCDSIAAAFARVYGGEVDSEKADNFDDFILYVGKFLWLTVEEVTNRGLKLSSPYIKEEIVNKDNFSKYPRFESYLLQNNRQVVGIVKEIKNNVVRVDVLDAYYSLWQREVETEYIKKEHPIEVYDLELTRGGFLGKVNIWTISNMLGQDYINTCFIPGSHIVLNIERDFNKWVDAKVSVLPQKFTTFSTAYSRNDNCLLCSRKQLLQYEGAKNLHELYSAKQLSEKVGGGYTSPEFEGTVTGVLKTSKKCGAFVELDDKYITGMLPCETYELSSYAVGDSVVVRIKEFEKTSDKTFVRNRNKNIQWPNMRVIFEK